MLQNTKFVGIWKKGTYWTMDMGGNSGKEECNPYVPQ